jgi:hypothetical protein
MKTFIAILITLSSLTALAGEVESKCGQVQDGVDRSVTKTDGTSGSQDATGSGVVGQ